MGDENGSGRNKIGAASHTWGQQTYENKKLLFTRQNFQEERHPMVLKAPPG